MSITSYAQNFEDVMLWRALGHVERGLYIDIGAQDPIIDSVSLAFHEHGWQGIHVEPTAHYAELLRQQRPGDTVIQAAVGQDSAALQFFEIPDTGISTADAAIAAQHRERGFNVQETTVPCIPLAAIFKTCAEQEIHWLKIDVEGFEQQVLSSWGTPAARPWIVVVESTLPLTQIETHQNWESVLIGHGYTPVYFDGLNRYYVSDTHSELNAAFATPPNVFDGFALNGTASAPFHQLIAARYQEKIAETEQEKAALVHKHGEQASALQHQYAEREQTLHQKLQALQEQLNRLQQERAAREQTLHEQNSQSRQELDNLVRQLVQREHQVAAQLLKAQEQASQEKSELTRSHGAQERSLRDQYAEKEATLIQQLQAGQQELQRLQLELSQQEKGHAEQASQARQEVETLLRHQVQREQEVAAQLLAVQQQAEQQRAELARSHSEQERTLRNQYAERETALNQQLQAGQQELQRLRQEWALREKEHAEQNSQSRQALESQLRNQVQREQEIAVQLLNIQQRAEQDKTELARSHSEQERALQREHADRQQVVAQQLQAAQETLRNLERDWAHNEKTLGKEIAALQNEALALHHAQQLQAQRHDAELGTKLDEHKRLISACATLEAQLKAEILFEQQTSLRLRQSLTEVQQSLATTHASLTWRMTAPLRTLASFIAPKKNPGSASPVEAEATDTIMAAAAAPKSINVQQAAVKPVEPISPANTHAANAHSPAHEMEAGVPPPAVMPPVSETPSINVQHASIEPFMHSSAQVTMPPTPALASTLDELLAYHDQQFVHCAYQTLLGRAPDPEGLGYYLGRLRTGFLKIQILAQLRLSNEGRTYAAKLPGLDTAIQRHQRGRYPLIGWLFRRLNDAEGNNPTERKLRGIENQIFMLSDESNRRFNQLETTLAGLQHLVVQQIQSVVAAPGSTPVVIPSASSPVPIQSPEPDRLKQLSPHARTIYFQLKAASAIYAGRTA